jgi:hypothetical protein
MKNGSWTPVELSDTYTVDLDDFCPDPTSQTVGFGSESCPILVFIAFLVQIRPFKLIHDLKVILPYGGIHNSCQGEKNLKCVNFLSLYPGPKLAVPRP